MSLRSSLVALLLAASFAASVDAQEWTRFRGPNGTGVSDDASIPTTWTDKDYLWKAELPGAGHSSPVIWGDKVFLTSALDDPQQRVVLCLDANTGKILWDRRFDYHVHKKHLLNSFASPTPAVDAEHVYVSWSVPESLTLMALTHDGRDVWKLDLGKFVSQHSAGNSPVVVGDMVVLVNEQDDAEKVKGDGGGETGVSYLHAVSCKDGRTIWQTPRKSATVTYSTPMVRELPDGGTELLFNSQAHGLGGIDPKTGKTNWEATDVLTKRSVSSPIMAAGLVFGTCGSGGGGNYIVAVKPGPKPEVVYKITEQACYVPTLVAKGNLLFSWSDAGVVSCLDAPTGEVKWRERVGGKFFGSPIIVGDRLYALASDGTVVVLSATDKFAELARIELGETSHSTPAVANHKLFLRTESHLYCVAGKK
ncbi:MAG: PQQ-binding-like beta-propeller repeat protein [Planctomycetaceae bacterium]|nr:PQQ-binding-like beta-propeller repeat protein [Planctomycetaceae bacterium]